MSVPATARSLIGAHVSVSGGLVRGGLGSAERIGAETVQIFVGNPRGWAAPTVDEAADRDFAEVTAQRGVPVFVHAPYLINLGSPAEETLTKSRSALLFSLRRAQRVGARGVVLHAGSALVGGDWTQAMTRLRETLLPVLDEAGLNSEGPNSMRLLIEPTAGGGGALASTLDSLAEYLDFIGRDERVGVCLDTCHLHAAGHDLSSTTAFTATMRKAAKVARPAGIGLIHVNDSRDPAGSTRDRHAGIGEGSIGLEPFGALFSTAAIRGVPMVVETADSRHTEDIATLKRLRAG